MKNLNIKKKYVLFIMSALLVLGGTEAFASNGFFGSAIGLIKNAFSSHEQDVINSTDQELAQIGQDYSNEIKKYINETYSQMMTDIEAYKSGEVTRGSNEINEYLDEFKNQVDSVAAEEKNHMQEQITQEVNKDVEKIKKDLDKDIDGYLKDIKGSEPANEEHHN